MVQVGDQFVDTVGVAPLRQVARQFLVGDIITPSQAGCQSIDHGHIILLFLFHSLDDTVRHEGNEV